MLAALSPNSDDADGCNAGRASSGHGHRDGVGTAAAAGNHDRWRTNSEPGADAIHHTGDLSLPRSLPLVGNAATTGDSGSNLTCGKPGRLAVFQLSSILRWVHS